MYMTGFCLNPMSLGTTIEGKSKCYRRRKPGHLPGRSLVNLYVSLWFGICQRTPHRQSITDPKPVSNFDPLLSQVWVDWETPVGDWETQEGQCCIHTPVQWRREGKKRRKELVWWQSHNLSALFERGKKKVLTHSYKGILHLHRYAHNHYYTTTNYYAPRDISSILQASQC